MTMQISFSLKYWWQLITYLGLFIISTSFTLEAEFIAMKWVFSCGLGLLFVGVASWMSVKTKIIPARHGFFSGPVCKPTWGWLAIIPGALLSLWSVWNILHPLLLIE